jgi:serine-type D-Ala-D-Ala carboxypeptidase
MSAILSTTFQNKSTFQNNQLNEARANESFAEVIKLMRDAVEDGVAPGMVLLVGKGGNIVFQQSFGGRFLKPESENASNVMSIETVFDVAAVTSVVVTTTLMMKLVESGKIRLEDKVARYLQGFGVMSKSSITVGQLLNHTSGIAHWAPYFEELVKANSGSRLGVLASRGAKDFVFNAIMRSALKHEPGVKQMYSELGVILLGHLVETLTGLALDKASFRSIFQPLGMKCSSYIDLSMIKRRGIHPVTDLIAPTEDCPWRKRVLCGEVHDDNAWAMGGVAGHSGLFTTIGDLHIFASEILEAYKGHSAFLKRETLEKFWQPPQATGFEGWFHGWDTPSRENGMHESALSKHAVGINGFTGCSLWLEPTYGVDIILLSNRIHPSRSNKKIFSFRPELHAAIIKALGLH